MKISVFIISFLFFVSLILSGCFLWQRADSSKNKPIEINVYNWGEYISSGVDGMLGTNKEFTKQTGIKVNYNTFATNEELYAKLAGRSADFDVIISSDYMIAKLISEGKLSKLELNLLPNSKFIDAEFLNPDYDPLNKYSAPYTWGCIGIFYNKDMVSEQEDEINWDILWNEKYKGKILMFDNARDSFCIAQKRLGIDFNTYNAEDWYKAAAELKRQKPLVQAYVMDQIFNKMSNNEAALAPYYAGDAVPLLRENKSLGFVIPKEGTNIFVDAMCIPEGSNKKEAAYAYINFMCDPNIAQENIKAIGYSTPSTEVKNRLNPEVANNPIYYPPKEILDKSQSFSYLPDDVMHLLDDLWIDVKIGGKNRTFELILVLSGFLIFYIAVLVYKKYNKISI